MRSTLVYIRTKYETLNQLLTSAGTEENSNMQQRMKEGSRLNVDGNVAKIMEVIMINGVTTLRYQKFCPSLSFFPNRSVSMSLELSKFHKVYITSAPIAT